MQVDTTHSSCSIYSGHVLLLKQETRNGTIGTLPSLLDAISWALHSVIPRGLGFGGCTQNPQSLSFEIITFPLQTPFFPSRRAKGMMMTRPNHGAHRCQRADPPMRKLEEYELQNQAKPSDTDPR